MENEFWKSFFSIIVSLKNISIKFTDKEIEIFKTMLYKTKLPLEINLKNDAFPSIIFSFKGNSFEVKRGANKDTFSITYNNSNTSTTVNNISLELLKMKFVNWTNGIKNCYNIMRDKYVIMVSDQFYNIYEDAFFLEKMGSVNSGMLYRKSLEFILLDYLKYLNPDINITRKFRTKDIKDELCNLDGLSQEKDKVLLDFIDKNFKIGHEFTHYRQQIDADVSELRTNIDILIELISEKVKFKEKQKQIYNKIGTKK
ncbi:hypothetical protein [Capnocytophaga canis]|uniref:hypothetical protein n=1 Tax=Capnocytophaga canis TaxID=1848903 RepID=UPI00156248B5|nr:hypothetical protein [Capnocytophaga canis]